MAPYTRPATSPFPNTSILSNGVEDLVRIVLLISIIAIAITYKAYAGLSLQRRRMLYQESSHQEKESISKPPHKRNDSTLSHPEDPNRHLQALKEELSQPASKPVYPWTAPPTPLPGPYDAPYYPLPLPSIRECPDNANPETPIKTEDVSEEMKSTPESTHTTSFTHHLSPDSTSDQKAMVRGTITISNHGWRRTHWTVSKG
jgi:hypothetical protein